MEVTRTTDRVSFPHLTPHTIQSVSQSFLFPSPFASPVASFLASHFSPLFSVKKHTPLSSSLETTNMDAAWGSKLGLIADSTLVTVFERNRCRTNGLSSTSQDKTIEKNMPRLREGLQQLEQELSQAEQDGSV
jgi:hypothetical protein